MTIKEKSREMEIEEAYEALKQCTLKEHRLSQKIETLKAEQIKAHNDTRLARDAVTNLKI